MPAINDAAQSTDLKVWAIEIGRPEPKLQQGVAIVDLEEVDYDQAT